MYNFENNNPFGPMDLLSVISLFIGYQNLLENRSQSAQNDVNAANDRQAQHILSEVNARLDRQDEMLKEILEVVRGGERA